MKHNVYRPRVGQFLTLEYEPDSEIELYLLPAELSEDLIHTLVEYYHRYYSDLHYAEDYDPAEPMMFDEWAMDFCGLSVYAVEHLVDYYCGEL